MIPKRFRQKFFTKTNMFLIFIFAVFVGLWYFDTYQYIAIPGAISSPVYLLLEITGVFLVVKIVKRFTYEKVYDMLENIDIEQRLFYIKVYKWFLYAIGIAFILYQRGVAIENLTIFLGFVATGLAFAVRDIILSYLAWMVLLKKRPFRINDYIKIGDEEGKVRHIGSFFVKIDKTPDVAEDYTNVPNRQFLEKNIINFGQGVIIEEIPFPLKDVPINSEKLLDAIKKDVVKIIGKAEGIKVELERGKEKFYVNVSYPVLFENKNSTKTKIIGKLLSTNKSYIDFGK